MDHKRRDRLHTGPFLYFDIDLSFVQPITHQPAKQHKGNGKCQTAQGAGEELLKERLVDPLVKTGMGLHHDYQEGNE